MRKFIASIALLLLVLTANSYSSNVDQAGTAASGRSASGALRLESIVGQNVSGFASRLTSGFYSEQMIPTYLAGDADGDGMISISDAVYLINFIFAGGPAPQNPASADADCSGILTISDAVYLINYIFSSGPSPQQCV